MPFDRDPAPDAAPAFTSDDVLTSAAQGRLKSIMQRLNTLQDERDETLAQIREVFAEGKSEGFDPKILRKAFRLMRQDKAKRLEEEAILDLYLSALEAN